MLLLKLLGYVYIYTNKSWMSKMSYLQLHNFMKEKHEKELHSKTSE